MPTPKIAPKFFKCAGLDEPTGSLKTSHHTIHMVPFVSLEITSYVPHRSVPPGFHDFAIAEIKNEIKRTP